MVFWLFHWSVLLRNLTGQSSHLAFLFLKVLLQAVYLVVERTDGLLLGIELVLQLFDLIAFGLMLDLNFVKQELKFLKLRFFVSQPGLALLY